MSTKPRKPRMPVMGEAFDSHFMSHEDVLRAYAAELRYYRPRGFAKLAADLERLADGEDMDGEGYGAMNEADDMLTAMARSRMRNEYVHFGPVDDHGGVGFWYAVDSALDDCGMRLDAGDSVPAGFSGMAAFITDHGNVMVATFSNGRKCRTILDVV
jgi:hypothetical protein